MAIQYMKYKFYSDQIIHAGMKKFITKDPLYLNIIYNYLQSKKYKVKNQAVMSAAEKAINPSHY